MLSYGQKIPISVIYGVIWVGGDYIGSVSFRLFLCYALAIL